VRDTIAFLLAVSLSTFVLLSLIATFFLPFFFDTQVSGQEQWAALFALMAAVLGAVCGWLGGSASTERRLTTPSDIDIVRPRDEDDA
jgi:hypothetical protein